MSNPLLPAILIWLLNCALAWVGVVRHAYRAYLERLELVAIKCAHINGLVRFAASTMLVNERFRCLVKLSLLGYSALTLWRLVDRTDELAPVADWRDVAAPLMVTALLITLTFWSELEMHRRPSEEPDEPDCDPARDPQRLGA